MDWNRWAPKNLAKCESQPKRQRIGELREKKKRITRDRDLESDEDLSGEDPLEKPEDLSDCVMFPPVVLIGIFVEPQSFSFSKKADLDNYAGRDEVRRFTSESAPALKKKNDAAHTTAKFILIIGMGAGGA